MQHMEPETYDIVRRRFKVSIDIRWLWTAAMASAPVDASNIPATSSLRPLTGIAQRIHDT
jgi:hypothetical protein